MIVEYSIQPTHRKIISALDVGLFRARFNVWVVGFLMHDLIQDLFYLQKTINLCAFMIIYLKSDSLISMQ